MKYKHPLDDASIRKKTCKYLACVQGDIHYYPQCFPFPSKEAAIKWLNYYCKSENELSVWLFEIGEEIPIETTVSEEAQPKVKRTHVKLKK